MARDYGSRLFCEKLEARNTYTMSPTPPAGSLFRRAPIPLTEMMYRFRAPELSAQFMMAPLCCPVSFRTSLVVR